MKPATAQQYIDCTDVRGGHAFTERFMGALRNAGTSSGFMRHLITGHIGGGKSSELVHLKAELSLGGPRTGGRKYLAVLLDASDFIDDSDATPNDVLIAIIAELASTLKLEADIELQDNYFTKRFKEFLGFLLRDVDVTEVEIPIWTAKAKIQLLKRNPSAREKVRAALVGSETRFLEEINILFEKARVQLRKKGYADIVLILDNLEKIRRLRDAEEGAQSHESLFISNASKFTGLACSFVLTVPLTLVRRHPGALRTAYGQVPFSLPMIKTRTRTGEPYQAGFDKIRKLLGLRGATKELLTQEAEDLLIQYSGGHVRDLLGTVREAISFAGDGPVELKHARSALGQIVNSLQVTTNGWERLAKLELDPDRKIDPDDPVCAYLLEQLFVLEYINGGEDENFIQHDETWYAAAPLLQGMRSFRTATKRIIDAQKSS